MNISTLLDMAESGTPERVALGTRESGITYGTLKQRVRSGASALIKSSVPRVVYLAGNGLMFPLTLFACAAAGIPIVPLNFRLGKQQLDELIDAQPPGTWIVRGDDCPEVVIGKGGRVLTVKEWEGIVSENTDDDPVLTASSEDIAVLLYTSGTSASPKAAVLRHSHLTSYIFGSVEFGSASDADATLVTVPPYHIAGVANALSNIYAGRRIVYLDRFTPESWLDLARAEGVSNAMLVPTMLARIVMYLDSPAGGATQPPELRNLAYGGARMPAPIIERALELFPRTDFVNAYGLTETSSTIAVLGPHDHREAMVGKDEQTRARLASAGRLVAGLEAEIRNETGEVLGIGDTGELWVRGPQVSGEYVGIGKVTDSEGWFPTKDLARIDPEGYLFIEGRLDDTIIRGGENIAPAEIEDVLLRHPSVSECAVVGVPDDEWGQRIVAVAVLGESESATAIDLRAWAVSNLRSSKTPDEIHLWKELPQTATGKVIRRRVLETLADETSMTTAT